MRSLKPGFSYLGIALVALVGCLDTASAQSNTLQVNPSMLTFNSQPGSPPPPQSIVVTSPGGSTNVVVTKSVDWLQVSPTSGATPLNLVVTIGPTAPTSGTAGGFITISSPSTSASATVFVELDTNTPTSNSALQAFPSSLTFTFQAGSTLPSSQSVQLSSTNSSVTSFTANAATNDGGNWLSVSPNFGSLPTTLTVTVNPAGLNNGSSQFSGVIAVNAPGTTGIQIPVVVNLNGTPSLTASPTPLSFFFQPGNAAPPAQILTVNSSTGTAVSFTAIPNTNASNCGNFIVLSPQSGVTPASLSVQINTTSLTLGNCTGEIDLFAPGANTPSVVVPVNLQVSSSPLLQVPTTGPAFTYLLNSNVTPAPQNVQITSSGTPLNFSVSAAAVNGGPNFLTVTPTVGTTPQQLTFTVNAGVLSSLAPGTYTENITVSSAGAANSPQTFAVTLTVNNNSLLNSTLSSLNFNFQIGKTSPPSQVITLSSSGSPLNFQVTTDSGNCPGFLAATPVTSSTVAPQNQVVVSVNTAGLTTPTTCTGTLTLTVPGSTTPALVLPVKLNVSTTPLINISPASLNVSAVVGVTGSTTLPISVTSTDPNTTLTFNATAATNPAGLTWLSVTPNSGSTPSNLLVTINPANLGVGTYTGTITVTSPSGPAQTIAVTLTVTNAAFTASPTSLTFNQALGGAAPASQTITLTGVPAGTTVGAIVTLLNGTGWLTATVSSNSSVTVTANGSQLPVGVYKGFVTLIVPGAANSPLDVPVTLVVGNAQTLVLSPNAPVSFTFQAGSTTFPATQTIQVSSTGGSVPFTASFTPAQGTANFLTVTPASGTTPGAITLALNQAVVNTLAPGTYTGAVTVASTSIPGGSQTFNVTLTVTTPAAPNLAAVVNSASFQPGSVSPGELVSLFGANIGPATSVGLQLTGAGTVSTNLGGTTVTFDGVAAPLTFVSANQINAIVPYEVAGHVTTNVVVTRSGTPSAALPIRVTDTVPAIFSQTQNGNGQGAILNQNFTVNSPANPAVKGTVIAIYATGEGQLVPGVATGSVTPSSLPVPKPTALPVAVTIGGQPAQIQFYGEAPGLVSGVLQINAVVPTNIGSGPQTIVLTIGGNSNSSQTITVSVQ